MKKSILLIFLFLFSLSSFAVCTIRCKVKYYHKIYHPPIPNATSPSTYFNGGIPIWGSGRDGYYEDVWSDTYIMNLSFYSGYELNNSSYPDNAIIAIVKWNNGGSSTIQIKGWSTKLKYMTEEEVLYDSNGNPIRSINGYDTKNNLWNIEFY